MKHTHINTESQPYNLAGLFTLALRVVVGWVYFSAFWRRLVLDYKLDPEASGYIGEKFNHFLPNSLGIQSFIEYLLLNPELLWWAMTIFTIIEGIVGFFFLFGFFTRLMSGAVFGLAMGILLGAGWLGTTCLDEWQIGVMGIAAGFTIFLGGSGQYSVDYWLSKTKPQLTNTKWFKWIGSGALPIAPNKLSKGVFIGSMAILFITLFTNQYFHGGVWGTLHNKSVRPKIEIVDANIHNGLLSFEVFRVEGADVYGSFLIGITLKNDHDETVLNLKAEDLAGFPTEHIENVYVAKVKPGPHSLIIPLGAKATLNISKPELANLPQGNYLLTLTDISGAEWTTDVVF